MRLNQAGPTLALLALLATGVEGQDDDERTKQREFEREVDKVLAEFRKTYSKRDVDRIDGIKQLAAKKHEKIVKELARFVSADADIVREAAIDALADLNHPIAAEALGAGFKANAANKKLIEGLLKAMEKQRWDTLNQGAAWLIEDFVKDATTPKSELVWMLMQTIKKVRSVVFIDPLIKLLKKAEEMANQNPAEGNVKFKEEVLGLLKNLTGQAYTTQKEWETWYRQAAAQLQQNCIHEYWCEKSWEHWEKLPSEKKKCPHHQDEKKKSTAKEIVCMLKPK
jgi:hypothetical protein